MFDSRLLKKKPLNQNTRSEFLSYIEIMFSISGLSKWLHHITNYYIDIISGFLKSLVMMMSTNTYHLNFPLFILQIND